MLSFLLLPTLRWSWFGLLLILRVGMVPNIIPKTSWYNCSRLYPLIVKAHVLSVLVAEVYCSDHP